MKQIVRALAAIAAVGVLAHAAPVSAREGNGKPTPVKLTKAEMAKIVAGTIEKVNGGGKTPSGEAKGIPYKNPAGKEPAGWNK
jgi:hypothetical protein